MRAHTQTLTPGGHGRSMVQPKRPTYVHFHCARGFVTPVLASMLDSLVRVSRRGEESHFVRTGPRPRRRAPRHSTSEEAYLPGTPIPAARPGPGHGGSAARRSGEEQPPDTGFLRFPFSNFRHSLTLFSKFFASFPHGTCSLSVSHRYLALDGIYHPL